MNILTEMSSADDVTIIENTVNSTKTVRTCLEFVQQN